MFKLNSLTGEITFPDGFVLPPPYDSDRYLEYAAFIHNGGVPELLDAPAQLPTVTVNKFQIRAALWQMGYLEQVDAFSADPTTDMIVRLAWQDAPELSSASLFATAVAEHLDLTAGQMNDVFRFAATITG